MFSFIWIPCHWLQIEHYVAYNCLLQLTTQVNEYSQLHFGGIMLSGFIFPFKHHSCKELACHGGTNNGSAEEKEDSSFFIRWPLWGSNKYYKENHTA